MGVGGISGWFYLVVFNKGSNDHLGGRQVRFGPAIAFQKPNKSGLKPGLNPINPFLTQGFLKTRALTRGYNPVMNRLLNAVIACRLQL